MRSWNWPPASSTLKEVSCEKMVKVVEMSSAIELDCCSCKWSASSSHRHRCCRCNHIGRVAVAIAFKIVCSDHSYMPRIRSRGREKICLNDIKNLQDTNLSVEDIVYKVK